MNWKLIISLASFGLLLGLLSLLGLSDVVTPWVYAIGGIFCSVMIAKHTQKRLVLHAILLGLLIGAIEAALGQLLVPTYLENNPELSEAYMWSFGLYFAVSGVVMGMLYAASLAIISWIASRFVNTRQMQVKPVSAQSIR